MAQFPITALREILILKSLNHRNVVHMHDVVTEQPSDANKQQMQVYMAFEYVDYDLMGLLDHRHVSLTPVRRRCGGGARS